MCVYVLVVVRVSNFLLHTLSVVVNHKLNDAQQRGVLINRHIRIALAQIRNGITVHLRQAARSEHVLGAVVMRQVSLRHLSHNQCNQVNKICQ